VNAAPALLGGDAVIYNNNVAFRGSDGNLQYVTVPLQGDVDRDGVVDSTDQNLVNNCLGQFLKNSTC
jgi:hypothetical protein